MGFIEWLVGASKRARAERYSCEATAHYWNGGTSVGAKVKNISLTGAYVYAPEQWYLGTLINMTLQSDRDAADFTGAVTLPCQVVRQGPDGIGVAFMFSSGKQTKELRRFLTRVMRQPRPILFRQEAGQAMIEFAFMVPLLFLLIVNVLNFGGFFYDAITIANAARTGAQYAALGASSVKTPPEATFSQVQALVQQETSALPNWSSSSSSPNPSITVCVNNNGTETILSSSPATSCTAAPTDPETAAASSPYTDVAVDVTYTYSPFIPVFNFPSLGIYATIPSTTIHRRAVMRVLN